MRNKQSGWTIWSLSAVIILVVILALLFMRLFPPYFDNLKLQEAMDKIVEDPRISNMTRRQIIQELDNILYIDYAHEVVDLKESLTIEKKDKVMTIAVDYEVVVPLVYNVSALLEFKNRAEIALR
jgi:hypothetical protein